MNYETTVHTIDLIVAVMFPAIIYLVLVAIISLPCRARISTLFCSAIKAGLELRYVTKITSIIGSDEILNRPHVCPHGPPNLFIEHLTASNFGAS